MARVLPAEVREVSGEEGSLAEAIAGAKVPKPDLVDFNDWQQWRKRLGKRPRKDLGDARSTTAQEEVQLHKATMELIYGASWRSDLVDQQVARAAQAEQAGPDGDPEEPGAAAGGVQGGQAPAAPAGPAAVGAEGAGSPPSGAVTPKSLLATLEAGFDPTKETMEAFQERVVRTAKSLEDMGKPLSEFAVRRLVRRAQVVNALAPLSQEDAKTYLKKEFQVVLMAKGKMSETESNLLMDIYMEELRARGQHVTSDAEKMFSQEESSAEVSPEQQARRAAAATEADRRAAELTQLAFERGFAGPDAAATSSSAA